MCTVSKTLNEIHEIQLLLNCIHELEGDSDFDAPVCVQNILSGHYENIICNEVPPNIVEVLLTCHDIGETIHNVIEVESNKQDVWFCLAIASLLYFVQCNWTGPEVDIDISWLKTRRAEALENLSLHDQCNENVKKPELLYLAKCIFSDRRLQNNYESCVWWLFRANILHQNILEDNSATIYDETEILIEKINEINTLKHVQCRIMFHLEVIQFYAYYRRIQKLEQHIECAETAIGITLTLEGAMGKRTKYQQDEKPQLYLSINMTKDSIPIRDCKEAPKSLDLNDELRLERVAFSEFRDKPKLGAIEEAFILAKYVQLQLSQPKDKLMDEEIKPYLTVVLDSTKCWPLKMTSLCHRCSLEADHKRTVERSMMQAEYLIQESFKSKSMVSERMDIFFASGMKPMWKLEEMWANLMLALGLVKGALEIFTKLQLWEDVIMCYTLLELKHKAAEIIRQEINKKPTVKLWCLLGDVTGDESHYETGWILSGQKSSRVQKHWGYFYFTKKDYQNAVPHLKLSVELNHIQENVWFKLGFAALEIDDWPLAATAYRHYCALESMTFEAWNNLAKAYIKLGNKGRAWKSLQDAIKCNYDRWEVWDNFMIVSIDLGHFPEVIQSYHRILDLKKQHLDIQVLSIIVNAIKNNIVDFNGTPSRALLQKTLILFGRISSSMPNNPDIWRLYAELTALEETDISDQKTTQYLQNAHRAAISNPRWFQQEDTTVNVLNLCCSLADAYLRSASVCAEMPKKKSLLASAKLALQGVICNVKLQQWEDTRIVTNLAKVEECFRVIIEQLETIKTVH